MRLTELLSPDCIKVSLSASDKQGVITEMVDLLDQAGKLSDRGVLLAATLEREATRTTGIGDGLAIPHGKCAAVSELLMAVAKAAKPVDFDSIDGKGVTIVILLASPLDKTGPHIQALARISRLMTDANFRRALDDAATPQEIYDLFERFEAEQE